ncbi:MAG: c-type cytochrome biogenesis protein CcsB [candidate division WOR-3 bacterium]
MKETTFIGLAILVYLGSWVFYLVHAIVRHRLSGWIADLLALAGLVAHTAAIVLRWVESHRQSIGHAPFSNLYESMVFFSWTIVLICLLSVRRLQNRLIGAVVMPMAFLALASTSLMNREIQPLVPALQSNWLTAHVITCFLGYAAFAVAFGVSLLYLGAVSGTGRKGSKAGFWARLPAPEILDEFSYRTIAVGFPMLTLGIITGAAWANSAWGSYWSWDPKETWSLIVWFIYAGYLHARIVRGWKGRRSAWLSVVGFCATLFCYLGVNLLLSGLHSYATG